MKIHAIQTIDRDHLVKLLKRINGVIPIRFSAFTEVSNLKQKVGSPPVLNPFQNVFKYNRVSGYLGKYHGVNRIWGDRICAALVQKNGNYYLPVDVTNAESTIYIGREHGQHRFFRIRFEDIAKFLPAVKPYKGENFYIRNYSLGSIICLEIGSLKYRVRINGINA